jgi:hypothetical protein
MATGSGRAHLSLGALILGLLLAPAPAFAHGEAGDHVAEFQKHLDDYEADVAKLEDRLDALAEAYAQGEAGEAEVDAFVDAWEDVRYHAAVEKVAMPLYPPIWQAIGGLRQAVKGDEPAAAVRSRTHALAAALREGLGGLKLKARMERTEGAKTAAEAGDSGPAAAFARIREALDHAVEEYAEGHDADARQHIRDAYFNDFEGLEGGLIEQDPELVAGLEEDFNGALPNLIRDDAPVAEVRAKVDAMKQDLARAEALLEQAGEDHGEVF